MDKKPIPLRSQYPNRRYEAGADIAADEWGGLKIVAAGSGVGVSVNRRTAPGARSKAPPDASGVGLWVDIGTAHHTSLR